MQPERINQNTSQISRRLIKQILLLVIVGFLGLTALSYLGSGLTANYVIKTVKINGVAMAPTLKHGDRVFILKRVDKLKRGDIVVFLYPRDQSYKYIERIIGLPGETIAINEGKVIIDGKPLDEPYIDYRHASKDTIQQVVIPPDHYFVLGDNRGNSLDSRTWGTVPRNLIEGKYWYRYWSASQAGGKN